MQSLLFLNRIKKAPADGATDAFRVECLSIESLEITCWQ